ncbi:hypothetical protein EOM81_10390 [bacterium]|nr:hypothetical protein [bacterium]
MAGKLGLAGRKCLGDAVRPKLITTIDKKTMATVDQIAKEMHLSRGQVIDYLAVIYQNQNIKKL